MSGTVEMQAASLLRLLCSAGPQLLAKIDRDAVAHLVSNGLASMTKRGSCVAATSKGYEHFGTKGVSMFGGRPRS